MAVKELLFMQRFTYEQYYFAFRDEIEIEETAWNYILKPPKEVWDRQNREAALSVLRRIDALKVAYQYDCERDQLRTLMLQDEKVRDFQQSCVKVSEYLKRPDVAPLVDDVSNFFAGMNSPDPEQRERFRRVYAEYEIADKTPGDVRAILAVAERAKGKGARPKAVPPWRHEARNMEAMRMHMVTASSVPEAARRLAQIEGSAQTASRAKYFERLYRQKMALREIKPPGL